MLIPTLTLILGGLSLPSAALDRCSMRVVTYMHAGHGGAEPRPLPRSTSANVADLRAMLGGMDAEPPYVLMGYSAWAFDMLYFAFNWPREVAGMVLVDPSITHMNRKLYPLAPELAASDEMERAALRRDVADARRCVQSDPGSAELTSAIALAECRLSEWESFNILSSDEVESSWRSLGGMPLIVLSANEVSLSNPRQADVHAVWKAEHRRYAALSSRGKLRHVEAGHDLPVRRPDIVAKAIEDVLAQIGE